MAGTAISGRGGKRKSEASAGKRGAVKHKLHASKGSAAAAAAALEVGQDPSLNVIAVALKGMAAGRIRGRVKADAPKIIDAYSRAVRDSEKTGKPTRIIVDVKPGGAPKIHMGRAILRSLDPQPAAAEASGDPTLARALAAARDRGKERVAQIVQGEDMLSADDFARHLGTTRTTVNAWRQKREVLALDGATRGFRYPVWQIGSEGKPFAILPVLFDRLGGSSWAVYRFLVQRHPELDGRTAREALEEGEEDLVLEAADSVTQAFA